MQYPSTVMPTWILKYFEIKLALRNEIKSHNGVMLFLFKTLCNMSGHNTDDIRGDFISE